MTGSCDDLLFEAFRYTADELSDAERSRFEERLATDQAAREAVAQTVQIAQAVAASPVDPVTPHPQSTLWSRRWAVIAALAACVCVALLVDHTDSPPAGSPTDADTPTVSDNTPHPAAGIAGRSGAAGDLVALWLRACGGADCDLLDGPTVAAPEPPLLAEADLTVPDWMLAAVSAERDELDGPGGAVSGSTVKEN